MESIDQRVRAWLLPVGILVLLGLISWWVESPLKLWWVACEGSAVLLWVAHGAWLEARYRRWNDRGVASLRAGELPPAPRTPPRGSPAVLCVALALSLVGLALLLLDLFGRIGRST